MLPSTPTTPYHILAHPIKQQTLTNFVFVVLSLHTFGYSRMPLVFIDFVT